ncbi:EF-hand calcium-binding domain-containing protein 6 [Trichonephila clavipes]|nr:EF-hand calcium-binding domain-containing protein 6 [Trichonephila clavipes]
MKNDYESSKSVDLNSDISSISSFTHHSKPHEKSSDIKYIISEKLKCRLSDIVQALKTFDKQRNTKILPANLHNVLNMFCYPLTAKDFNELLKKIGQNLKNFIRCMWLYDFNHDGLIQKHEFRNVLENYCFCLTDDQYDRLWSLYDPAGRGVLNYKDFLLKLGTRSESYKRIMPKDLHFKPSSTSLNVIYSRSHNWHVSKSLMEKLRNNMKDSENFFKNSFTITSQNKTIIPRAELRRTINQYLTFPIAEEEFRSLMFILDPGHSNMIDCDKFLSLLIVPSTLKNNGMSKQPSSEEIHPGNAFAQLSGERLKKEFKKCFNKNLKNIEKAINAFDAEETGFMLPSDLKKILESFCFPLNDSQCREIFGSFPIFNNKIFYSDFIHHYKKGPYENEEKWAVCVKKLTIAQDGSAKKLSNEEVLRHVKEAVRAQKEIFLKEFKNHDYCNAGIVKKEVFSKLISKYICRLTNEQLNLLWNMLPVNEIGLLKYEVFLNDFIQVSSVHSTCDKSNISSRTSSPVLSVSSKKSSHSINGAKNRPKTAGSVSSIASSNSYKLISRPKSAVTKHSWEQQSKRSGESIRNNTSNLVVEGQGCSVLTSEQYKQYRSFNFANVKVPSEMSYSNGNAKINGQTINHCINLKKQESVFSDPKKNDAVKAEYSYYEKIFIDSIKSRWRDILRRCKAKDWENTNIISWNDFIDILPKTGITINDEILNLLETEYNIRKDIPVNYWTFFKKILLALGYKRTMNDSTVTSSPESVSLYKVLLTNRDKILKNYRDLRYAFRRADQQHSGSIKASEFRRILALHKIHLSENDFFYICDYFDPKLTEKIPYDDFLEAFTQK